MGAKASAKEAIPGICVIKREMQHREYFPYYSTWNDCYGRNCILGDDISKRSYHISLAPFPSKLFLPHVTRQT